MIRFVINDHEFTLSEKMIEDVLTEWHTTNPFEPIDEKTFAERCIEKVRASAIKLQIGHA